MAKKVRKKTPTKKAAAGNTLTKEDRKTLKSLKTMADNVVSFSFTPTFNVK